MDRVNYLSNSTTSQSGKYPVTVEGLDFIQSQILLLQNIAFCGGDNYVIKEPEADPEQYGLIVWDGEVLPLSGVPASYVQIISTKTSVNTPNGSYKDVREVRLAQYVSKEAETPETATLRKRTSFQPIETNIELSRRITENTIPVLRGVFTQQDLDNKLTSGRLVCLSGSWRGGIKYAGAYVLEVYRTDAPYFHCYQIAIFDQKNKYIRYYRGAGTWGEFEPYAARQNFNIEAKITGGKLLIRHSPLPSYCKLILLRKKRRGKTAGRDRPDRPIKSGWFHSWGVELSKGVPEQWYSPICVLVDGKPPVGVFKMDFVEMIKSLMFKTGSGRWHIPTVKKKWSESQNGAFADLAIAIIDTHSHRYGVANTCMVKLRFRVWKLKNGTLKQCLSVK